MSEWATFIAAREGTVCNESYTPTAVSHVSDPDTGIASALLNTAQQVGGALGLAILSTIATSASNHRLPDAAATLYRGFATHNANVIQAARSALTHGYTTAFFLAGLTITVLAINTARPDRRATRSRPPARE